MATGLIAALAYLGPPGSEVLFMRWFGAKVQKEVTPPSPAVASQVFITKHPAPVCSVHCRKSRFGQGCYYEQCQTANRERTGTEFFI
ncbi:hypothetical protein [Ensifer aridi]|uniref:hypothetical protein n=1 Tax=Ensifer aridi TaxID=1708715 RepID=UPI000A10CCF0|nr:hypothetical protein [Ensifer aridi]